MIDKLEYGKERSVSRSFSIHKQSGASQQMYSKTSYPAVKITL